MDANCRNAPATAAAKGRTAMSANRVMRFCCPDGHHPASDLFDATGVEYSTPAGVQDTNVLPLFGDITPYGATQKQQRGLWDLEIHRLLLETERTGADTLIPKLRASEHSQLQSPIHKAGLGVLQTAADQLLHSLHLCVIDDQTLINDAFSKTTKAKGIRSYQKLHKVAKVDIRLPGQYEGTNAGTYTEIDDEEGLKYSVAARAISESELEDYYYLVDQITATIARVAILGSNSQYWHVVVLACLSKLSTKLKFLAPKLDKNIAQSLKRNKRRYDIEDDELQSDAEGKSELGHLTDSSPTVRRYCTEFDVVTTWLVESTTQILEDLGARKPWGLPSDQLDLCAIVYQAGIPGIPTVLHQDRGGSISGSSAAIPLEYSSVALRLLHDLGTSCFSVPNANSTGGRNITNLTFESVEFLSGEFEVIRKTWRLRTIMELVVVVIPLSLSCPAIGCGFETSLRTISALSAFGETRPPTTSTYFSAFVNLRSSQSTCNEARREFSSLSESVITSIHHNALERRALVSSSSGDHSNTNDIRAILTNGQKQRRLLKEAIDAWAIQETSIVVGCATYVHHILLLSAALVIGGLLCGFLVGERIAGVDPFNLTMFSWIVGGFVILIAKSVMVSDWTWRDFLLRQVTCRSLSEVSTVTGLNAQDVLAFLLSSQFRTPLMTRGPYQKSFTYQSEADGFSIDIKPTLQTLLASGVIPATVSTLNGPVLICLTLAQGTLGYQRLGSKSKFFRAPVYIEFPDFGVTGDAFAGHRPFSSIKVLGLYNSMMTKFR